MSSSVRIETERLVLTLAGPEHVSRLAAYFRENRERFVRTGPPLLDDLTKETVWAERVRVNAAEFEADRSMRLLMLDRHDVDGPVLGLCNFVEFRRGPLQQCELGYNLATSAQGRGLMQEALRGAIPYVFETLGFHRIVAGYAPWNERSGRVLKRLGFLVEGYARDYLYLGGEWHDHVLTALVNPRPETVRVLEFRRAG